jgi:hypothetical protein
MIYKLARKVHSSGSFLVKKYTGKNAVLMKGKLDETAARLEHLPHKSPTSLTQQAHVLITTL